MQIQIIVTSTSQITCRRFLKLATIMNGLFLIMFEVFIAAAESVMAIQKYDNSELCIIRPL